VERIVYEKGEPTAVVTKRGERFPARTQDKKTQRVGIEEKNGTYREKPVFADKNLIEDNILSGHEIDIIVAGQNTVCGNNKATKIVMPEKKDAQ
ncbi:MAG: hypothetical protein NC937_05565, partial [Candidatus Omnitrophica bacterium]|nr:hypothetical protein [Candidatus Omnitrophota bacterium]